MTELEQQMVDRGFVISKKVLSRSGKGLYIDDVNKKWVITGSNLRKLKRFDYNQVVDYEIFENGSSVTSGRAGSALIGGMIAGVTGAIVGGSRQRKTTETVSKYQLRITLNDLKHPSIVFDFPAFGFPKDSFAYHEISEQAHEMVSLITYMMNNA